MLSMVNITCITCTMESVKRKAHSTLGQGRKQHYINLDYSPSSSLFHRFLYFFQVITISRFLSCLKYFLAKLSKLDIENIISKKSLKSLEQYPRDSPFLMVIHVTSLLKFYFCRLFCCLCLLSCLLLICLDKAGLLLLGTQSSLILCRLKQIIKYKSLRVFSLIIGYFQASFAGR